MVARTGVECQYERLVYKESVPHTVPHRMSPLRVLRGIGFDEACVAVEKIQDEVVGGLLHSVDDRLRLAEVALGNFPGNRDITAMIDNLVVESLDVINSVDGGRELSDGRRFGVAAEVTADRPSWDTAVS